MASFALVIVLLVVAGIFAVRWLKQRAQAMARLLSNGERVTGKRRRRCPRSEKHTARTTLRRFR